MIASKNLIENLNSNFSFTVVSTQTWQTKALWPKCLTMRLNIN